MPKVMLKLFFKNKLGGEKPILNDLIENALRYLIPFHLIIKNKELLCHLKLSDNIFQQLKLSVV